MPLSVDGELTLAEALALWQTGPSSREQCEAALGAVFHHAAPLCFCSSSSFTAVSAQERVSEASEGAAAVAQAAAASIALSGQSARIVTVEASAAVSPTAEPSASSAGVASAVQLPAAQSASKKKCDIVEVATSAHWPVSALTPVKAAWPASPPHSPCTTFTEAAVVSDRAFDCAVARAEAAFAAIGRLRPDEEEGAQAEALAAAAAQSQAAADAAADAEIDRADAEARARFEAAKAAVRAQADAAHRLAAEQQAAAQQAAQAQAEADARVRDAADAAAAEHLAAELAAAEKTATAAAAAATAAKAKADADAKAAADKLSAEQAIAARAEVAARASQDAADARAADARAEKEAAGKACAAAEAQALADAVARLRADADAKAKAEQASRAAAAKAAAEVAAAQAQASAQQRAGEKASLATAQASAAAAAALNPARLTLSPPREPLPSDEVAALSPSRVYVNAVFESSEEQPRALPPAPRSMVATAEEIAGALLRLLPDHHRCAELLLPLPAQLSGGVLASSLLSEAESAAIMHAMQARRRGWQPASRSEDAAVCAQDAVPSRSEESFQVAEPAMAEPEATVPLLEEEQLAPPVAPAAVDEPMAVGAAPCTTDEPAAHLEAEECPTPTPTRAPLPPPDSPPAQPSPNDPLPPPPALELAASACVDPLTPRSPDAPDESDEALAPTPAPPPARGPPQAHALSLLTADEVAAALAGQPRCGELLMALPPALASAALASTVLEEGAGVAMMHAYLAARSSAAGGAVTAPLRLRGEEGMAEGRKESQSTPLTKQRTPQKLKHVKAHAAPAPAPAPAASPWTGADALGREGDLSWRQVVDVSRAAAAAIDAQPLDAAPAGAPPSPAQRRGWVRAALGAGAGLLGAALLAAGGPRGRPRTAAIPPTPLDSGTPPSARGRNATPSAATPVRKRETEAALVAPPFLFYDPDAGRPLTPGKYKQ